VARSTDPAALAAAERALTDMLRGLEAGAG
jgi:hypothetical protein